MKKTIILLLRICALALMLLFIGLMGLILQEEITIGMRIGAAIVILFCIIMSFAIAHIIATEDYSKPKKY